MRVLVDTCVIIDALQSRVPFAEAARKAKSSVKVCETSALIKLLEEEKNCIKPDGKIDE